MAQYIKQGDLFGRVGTGFAKGLAEQLPKEMERNRISSGLKALGDKKNLTPFESFAELAGIVPDNPQLLQTGGDILRQQAIINSADRNREPKQELPPRNQPIDNPYAETPQRQSSPTTVESTEARLKPYVPPTAQDRESEAFDLMKNEPQKYRTLDEARGQVDRNVAAETQRSDARIKQGQLERDVGNVLGAKLSDNFKLAGVTAPPVLQEKLQNQAISDVTDGILSEDEAVKKYTKEATEISKNFANLAALGGIGTPFHNHRDLFNSLDSYRQKAQEGRYKPEAADQMVTELQVTPQFAYSRMYPVKEIGELNNIIKSLPDIKGRIAEVPQPGMKGSVQEHVDMETRKICGKLAAAMGLKGSPLSIAYELEKRGYNPVIWKEFLQRNSRLINLTNEQNNELGKPQPGFWGKMNDLFLRDSTGVE